jgi:hypothetical protein
VYLSQGCCSLKCKVCAELLSNEMTLSQQTFTHPDDLIAIWRHYVQSVLTSADEDADPACKALVADEHAMRMITIACPMTLLMEYRIYDIHSLGSLLDTVHRTELTGEETVLSHMQACCRSTILNKIFTRSRFLATKAPFIF